MKTRSKRRLAAAALSAVAAAACAAGPAAAAASPDAGAWHRSLAPALSRQDLGLPAGASSARLAARAIRREQRSLVQLGQLGDLHFDGRLNGDPALHALGFTQRLDGLRVLWSHLEVVVARGEAALIGGTVVPLRDRTLSGEVKIAPAQARRIARRAVMGAAAVGAPELVAYAGTPDRPRPPRRAYVVEVTRPSVAEGSADGTCVVIDAGSGTVLTQWRGHVAPRPQPSSRAAGDDGAHARAAGKTTLVQVDDAWSADVLTTDSRQELVSYFSPYLFTNTSTDRYGWPFEWYGQTAYRWAADVSRFFCLVRNWCGRDGGQPGPVGGGNYNRVFFTARWGAPAGVGGMYFGGDDRIAVATSQSNSPGVFAHEFGHMIDRHARDDYFGTREGDEIKEALADMFALDYERRTPKPDASYDMITRRVDFAHVNGLPTHFSQYRCSGELHDNGYILSHAFLDIADLIGFDAAGRILQGVPWALPGRRTFGSVRTAFEVGARALYGASSYELTIIRGVFNQHGVAPGSTRTQFCGSDGF